MNERLGLLRTTVFLINGLEAGSIAKRDNGSDHRAGTNDHPFQKHAQARLRVHHIVIRRFVHLF